MDKAQLSRTRIVFAPRVNKDVHLSRHRLADLFLDTLHYGAHTTATDALYLGVPIITTPGRTFASRVCAGIMLAAGLEEFVVQSRADYVELAVAMANGDLADKLQAGKLRLRTLLMRHIPALWSHDDNPDKVALTASIHGLSPSIASAPLPLVHTPLFHVALFTAALEQALTAAFTRRVCAEAVPDVSSLFPATKTGDGVQQVYMWQLPLVVSRRAAAEEYWARVLHRGYEGERVKLHKTDFEDEYYMNPETIVNMNGVKKSQSVENDMKLKDEL